MKTIGQFIMGISAAFGSSLLVLAAILLSLAEGSTMSVAPTLSPAANVTRPVLSFTPDQKQSLTPTRMLVVTATQMPPVVCPTPPGWTAYTLVSGDTLEALSARSAVTVDQIREANCLLSASLLPGTILYLPAIVPSPTDSFQPSDTPTPWPTPTLCMAPPGWIRYQVKSNDTLTRLSQAYGVRVDQLMAGNCLNSSFIMAGTYLLVPNVPTRTPQQTITQTPTNTPLVEEPSPTVTQEPSTETPTLLPPGITPTPTETLIPSETPSPSPPTPSPAEDQASPTASTPLS